MKRASEVPPPVSSFGSTPVCRHDCLAQRVHQVAGLGQERFAADRDVEVEALRMLGDRRAQPGGQRSAGVVGR